MATLAAEKPGDPDEVGDPSGEAIQRFLSWVENSERRQVALDAALPRRLNRDVLAALVDEEKAQSLFPWLKEMPFVEKRGSAWVYHDVVRSQMLRYKRQESPKDWTNLHNSLALRYEKLRDNLGFESKIGRRDEVWQGYALEALYHQVCSSPKTQLTPAINGFLAAWNAQRTLAIRWARVLETAGQDADAKTVEECGQCLGTGLQALEREDFIQLADMLAALLERSDLENYWRAWVLDRQGQVYGVLERYEEALVHSGANSTSV